MKVLQRDIKLKGKPFLEKHGIKYDLSNYQMDAVLKAGGYKFWYDDEKECFFTNAPKFKDKGYLSIVELLANVFDIDDESRNWRKKVLQESNSDRREFTKQKREEQLLNQNKKVTPRKVIIVDNDATKKLTKLWEKGSFLEKGDSLGKIKLDPTPNGYGKSGVYGVWEAVKGKSGMYADIKTIDGVKWSFTELWLDEEGAKKLQNNIVPLRTDFERSSDKSLSNYKERRRLNALKDKNKTGEQQLKQDIINYKNNYSDGFLSKHPNISAYNFTGDSKKVTRENEVYKNLEKIVEPLKYMDNKDASKIYWSINDIIKIKDTKERAAAIDNLKKEVDNFLKNNKKQTYFNY